MEVNEDKTTEEVMNCLLSMSKMQSTEQEVQYWQNYQEGEPAIIWKLDGEDGMVQVPIEYKIEKYVVTQSLIPEVRQDVETSGETSKVVLIQNLPSHSAQFADLRGSISYVDGPVYEQQTIAITEPEPASFRTDSSYSESIDVEVEDSDHHEDLKNCAAAELILASPKKGRAKKSATKTGVAKKKQKRTKKWLKKLREDDANPKKVVKPKKAEGAATKAAGAKTENLKYDELTRLEDNADQVADRFKLGCECASNCFDGFIAEKVFRHRLNIADLTKAEHDMYLMGVIHASMQNPEETCRKKERLRIRTTYAYHGKRVCLTAFLYLEHVTLYQMKRIRKHLQHHGVSPRIHGNHGRKPSNTLPLDIYQHATHFVQNFIEQHHVKNNATDSSKAKTTNKSTCYRLPADYTKKTLHDEYRRYCEESMPTGKIMQYSTFTNFFKKQFPNVKFRKPEKFIEKRVEEPQAIVDERQRRVRKKCKNKVVQTTGPPPPTDLQVPAQHYRSPYLILGPSQVLLEGEAPLILHAPSDVTTHFLAEDVPQR